MKFLILASFLSVILSFKNFAVEKLDDYIFNVIEYGAKGDGISLDTEAIQKAVNDAGLKGGKVVFPPGKFLSGTIFLKNNVTLEISEGAILLGSTNLKDYPDTIPDYRSYNDLFLTQSLIYGEDLNNISIIGNGIIDGQGSAFKVTTKIKPDRYKNRPFVIRLVKCSNILIKDITLKNSAMWMQHYLACDYLRINGIKVFNHANKNNDMMDIDGCHNVIISDCFGDTDDDAITLKSTSSRLNENVTINNCVISSHVNAIKMGTESSGGFKNITISNIIIKPSSVKTTIYGEPSGIGGIALEVVDGGIMDGVTISNINIYGVQTPLFIRLGNRGRTFKPGMETPKVGAVKNISISNIVASGADTIASSFSGLKNFPIENISLSNIKIIAKGGGGKISFFNVPEKEKEYPESSMFGNLPAYGFYIRHAKNITLNNISFTFERQDLRPAVVCDDVDGLRISDLNAKAAFNTESIITLNNSKNVNINNINSFNGIRNLISIYGKDSKNIIISTGNFNNEIVKIDDSVNKNGIKINEN